MKLRDPKTCTHGEAELRLGHGGGAYCRLCGSWAHFAAPPLLGALDVERLARALVAGVHIDAYRSEPLVASKPDEGYHEVAAAIIRALTAALAERSKP